MIKAVRTTIVAACCFAAACGRSDVDRDFVARVGNSYLDKDDLELALSNLPVGLDSTHAAEQFIDRWVTDELLAQEARGQNLQNDPDVRRRMEESERSVLIGTLVSRMYREVEIPTDREIRAYFDRNVDNLTLRESFLRIRYLSTYDSAAAVLAVAVLDTLDQSSRPDSTWRSIVGAAAIEPEVCLALSVNYFPESRFFRNIPELTESIERLRPGQTAPIIRIENQYHVIHLVDRVPAGTKPNLEWVVDDIRNRLLIDKRKQMYLDQVQRLRNSALARGRLELRTDSPE